MFKTIKNPRGYLKFSDNHVTIEQLENFAQELAADPKYLSVYIRKVSKDQHGIGFVCNTDTSDEEAFDKFSSELKDICMRKFGIGYVGWDIASSYIVIK
jgi:hypothetical protein